MANHCRLAADTAVAMVDAWADLLDAGDPTPGYLVGYTGSEPSYADDAAATEVFTCTLPLPAFGAAAADLANHRAAAAMASTASDTSATGNASAVNHYRLYDGNDAIVAQGTLGTAGTDIVLNADTIGAGSQVDITSLELRLPYNQA